MSGKVRGRGGARGHPSGGTGPGLGHGPGVDPRGGSERVCCPRKTRRSKRRRDFWLNNYRLYLGKVFINVKIQ